jgi:hypothetical protein
LQPFFDRRIDLDVRAFLDLPSWASAHTGSRVELYRKPGMEPVRTVSVGGKKRMT